MASVLEAPQRPTEPWATTTLRASERIRPASIFYDYAGQDPINNYDLNGTCWSGLCWAKHLVEHPTQTLIAGGGVVVGTVATAGGAAVFLACERGTEGLYTLACEKAASPLVSFGVGLTAAGVYGLVKASHASKPTNRNSGARASSQARSPTFGPAAASVSSAITGGGGAGGRLFLE